jgi:hypothetical protein
MQRAPERPRWLHLGIFGELAEANDVLPRALALAASLATFPPEIYARNKRDLRGRGPTVCALLRLRTIQVTDASPFGQDASAGSRSL